MAEFSPGVYSELLARVSLARLSPDDPGSETYLTEALEMAEPGFTLLESIIRAELGLRALRAGRLDNAERLCSEALELARNNAITRAAELGLFG